MPNSPPHKKYGLIAIAATVAVMVAFLFAINGTLSRRSNFQQQQRIAQLADKHLCLAINKLKQQNLNDVAESKRDYHKNLKLLHIPDTPALRKAQERVWAREVRENTLENCEMKGAA